MYVREGDLCSNIFRHVLLNISDNLSRLCFFFLIYKPFLFLLVVSECCQKDKRTVQKSICQVSFRIIFFCDIVRKVIIKKALIPFNSL